MMMGFIACMHNKGYAPPAMISMVSAISYFHKLNGFPDPAKHFIIAKLLTEAQNLGTVSDVRLPVTMSSLLALCRMWLIYSINALCYGL